MKNILKILSILVLSLPVEALTFQLTPYAWMINMNGSVGVGNNSIDVKEDFGDILKKLEFAGMIDFGVKGDLLGAYINAIYANLSASQSVRNIDLKLKNGFGIISGGLSYETYSDEKIMLEPYLGFRYTFNDTSIKVLNTKFKDDVKWTDVILGLKTTYNISSNWSGILFADFGGTNFSKHYSYNLALLFSYAWDDLKLNVGYRLLDQKYEKGSGTNFYKWDMKLFGPIVALTFVF